MMCVLIQREGEVDRNLNGVILMGLAPDSGKMNINIDCSTKRMHKNSKA